MVKSRPFSLLLYAISNFPLINSYSSIFIYSQRSIIRSYKTQIQSIQTELTSPTGHTLHIAAPMVEQSE